MPGSIQNESLWYQREIMLQGLPLTLDAIRTSGLNSSERAECYLKYLTSIRPDEGLVGKEFSPLTWKIYSSRKHTMISWNGNTKLRHWHSEIELRFITDYEFWLKSVRKCDHNTTLSIYPILKDRKHLLEERLACSWSFPGIQDDKREVERRFR